jgi:protein SCO1/2
MSLLMRAASLLVALGLTTLLTGAAGRPALIDPTLATLVDQAGRQFNFRELRGRPVAVTFIATRCDVSCPLTNAWFAKLQERVKRQHVRAALVTITLDPEYDTPRVMSRAAAFLGADSATWRFASGSVAAVDSLLAAFRVEVGRDAYGIPSIHTNFVYFSTGKVSLHRFRLPRRDSSMRFLVPSPR